MCSHSLPMIKKNDNFFLKKRLLHNQTSVVLETKQTSLGSRKKNKSGNPQIDHSVHDTYFNYRFSIFF